VRAIPLDQGLLAGKAGSAAVAVWVGAISVLLRRDDSLSKILTSAGVAAAAGTVGAVVLIDQGPAAAPAAALAWTVALAAEVIWGVGTGRRALAARE
jgi:hypothetical protein